jgi:hypothetical protein
MRKTVPFPTVVSVFAIATVLIGFIVYRTLFSNPNDTPIRGVAAEKAFEARQAVDYRHFQMSRDVPYRGK